VVFCFDRFLSREEVIELIVEVRGCAHTIVMGRRQVKSQVEQAILRYPRLHLFLRLHVMRPLIARRLHDYWTAMTTLYTAEQKKRRPKDFDTLQERMYVTRERYVQIMRDHHELLVEVAILFARNKKIQSQCLRLIHLPFPTIERVLAYGKESPEGSVRIVASVELIIERVEEEYLQPIEQLIRMVREDK
jgi:hypothetical protein